MTIFLILDLAQNRNDILSNNGVITKDLVLAVLDNGAVLDRGLALLHVAVISDESQQLVEDLGHASRYGRCTCGAAPATWRALPALPRLPGLGRAEVVFDVAQQQSLLFLL